MNSPREAIIEKVEHLTDLPSMNETVRLVQQQLSRGSHTASAAELGRIIEKDLGLAAKVLKIANSVYYSGRYGQIGNVSQAVARMGLEEVNRICTTIGSIQLFAQTKGTIDLTDFWKHSLAVAIVMRHIAGRAGHLAPHSQNAYAAGLFHDIGILVLDRFFASVYSLVLKKAREKTQPLHQAELDGLGIGHGEIGLLVCRRWRLPEEIGLAIEAHHAPDACPEEQRRLAQLIHIANFTCSVLGIPEPGDWAVEPASHGAWHDLGLDNCDLNEIAKDVEEGITKSGVFLSLSV